MERGRPRREVFENWVEYLDISNRQLMNLHAFGNGNRAGSKHLRLLVNRFCNAELNGARYRLVDTFDHGNESQARLVFLLNRRKFHTKNQEQELAAAHTPTTSLLALEHS
ncbi:uncharacterized protein LOC112494868 isoform X1 [Cephus cinctus]|uniref:Uncharacterized protein LOC112494868 isoform X1 n=1 Tax=Cephus cinctus TaxID=211228 RepID=A0AAJ7RNH6_CEPCN|nr:uncharacterized protein LOC112494868 isoform X1 [Cephus cinctus]